MLKNFAGRGPGQAPASIRWSGAAWSGGAPAAIAAIRDRARTPGNSLLSSSRAGKHS